LSVIAVRKSVNGDLVEIEFPPGLNDFVQLECSDTTQRVRSPKDLEGHVSLREPEDALDYLRFFSSVDTTYLFEDELLEISLDPDGVCAWPCLSSERWKQLGLEAPRIHVTHDGYEVTRHIVRPFPSPTDVTAYRVIERVSRDGEVEILSEERIPLSLFDKAALAFPGRL
jgi:hypothetical protein